MDFGILNLKIKLKEKKTELNWTVLTKKDCAEICSTTTPLPHYFKTLLTALTSTASLTASLTNCPLRGDPPLFITVQSLITAPLAGPRRGTILATANIPFLGIVQTQTQLSSTKPYFKTRTQLPSTELYSVRCDEIVGSALFWICVLEDNLFGSHAKNFRPWPHGCMCSLASEWLGGLAVVSWCERRDGRSRERERESLPRRSSTLTRLEE